MPPPAPELVAPHLQTLADRYAAALAATGYDAVLLGAGTRLPRFLDDQPQPFTANPLLMQWLPVPEEAGALLLFRPGHPPRVVLLRRPDFWHQPPPLPDGAWTTAVDLRLAPDLAAAVAALDPLPARTALVGPAPQWSAAGLAGDVNPPQLLAQLHYGRAVKTPHEVACLREASVAAAAGHRAAAAAFARGETEFGILLAFLAGTGQTAAEMPYPPIVAGDGHAAVLHYQHYERHTPPARSLLIDAGAGALGYAADVTRTHARPGQDDFAALLAAMDGLQRELCAAVRPGLAFAELHHQAHAGIAQVLAASDLVRAPAADILESGLTRHFFPHGLGHLLGLQVHDVGGRQAGPDGGELPAPAAYPGLRLLRTLAEGFTLTIEPGLYFIESLLAGLREHPLARAVNWAAVDKLQPCGGIRIEDNLLVTANGAENLTRRALAD